MENKNMRNILPLIRLKIMFFKVCLGRAMTYLTIINAGMLLIMFLQSMKEKGVIRFDLSNYFILIFLVGLVLLVVVGWIEIRFLKGAQTEASIGNEFNPYFMEIKNRVANMEEKINKIYEKLGTQ